MSSGNNVREMDWTWQCPDCHHENEDVTVYVDGVDDYANATCEACGHETEVAV
jgi:transcription elongation factor Elf1